MRTAGVFMTDGYEPYEAVAEQHRLVHLGCWAHCRRYVNDALQALPKDKRGPDQLAVRLVELIGKLYHVEAEPRRTGLDAQALHRQRQERSVVLLKEIEDLMLANLHTVLPSSLMGKALHYLAGQWRKLVRFVADGRYPIDNNPCENSIRPFVVGRRNWLFSDTVAGAHASANLYSLLQTCVANGIDGYRYLAALLPALPAAKTVEDYEVLLSWHADLSRR
jgi:transposase